jgi:hypothetical protein
VALEERDVRLHARRWRARTGSDCR